MSNNENFYIDQKVAESFFREFLQDKRVYRIFNIYGQNGMGKSCFLQHIKNKYLTDNSKYAVINIDFANRLMQNPLYTIMQIAKNLENIYDFDFLSLWKAYAILWQKRYDKSLIMYANDLPYVHEIKKLLNIDKRGRSFIRLIRGLFKDDIYEELERLKGLETKDIEKRLFFFFAEDLKNLIKEKKLKDSVIIIDNHNLLEEKSYSSFCKKDAWIRELVSYLGKNTLFIIASKEPIAWYNCNIALKSNIREYEFKALSFKDAKRYLEHYNIKDERLQGAILNLTAKKPLLLYISKEAYSHKKNIKNPVETENIFNDFFNAMGDDKFKLLKILSNARVIRRDFISTLIKNYKLNLSFKETEEFLDKEFFKEYEKDKYYLDNTIKAKLLSKIDEEDKKDYLSFIFSYYENILQNLDKELIQNSPQLIDEIIEESWFYLKLINKNIKKHLEWLNYYVSRFYMYAAWETFIERYLQILPELEKRGIKEDLVLIYNNLAGLYESIGEAKLAKEYYNRMIKLNRPLKLSA